MAYNQVEQAAFTVAQPVVESLGYEFVDVSFEKEVQNWVLSVYVDKSGGITLDDCEIITHALDPIFDADPVINGRHDYLSVSSPGLDRRMKTERDWQRSIGKELDVKTFAAVEGQKSFTGILTGVTEDSVTLTVGSKVFEIPRKGIASAKLTVHF